MKKAFFHSARFALLAGVGLNLCPVFLSGSVLGNVTSLRGFGAVGNGVVDDTQAVQKAMTAGETGRAIYAADGCYSISAITLGNPATVSSRSSSDQGLGIISLYGDGRRNSLFSARPGTETVLKRNNLAGISIRNIGVLGQGKAQIGLDLSWRYGSAGAPSNMNILENVFIEECKSIGAKLQGFHDSKIDGLWVRGCPIGIDLSASEGGQMVISNSFTTGLFKIGVQNAGVINCGLFGGIELTGGGYNNITFQGCHVYGLCQNGININSTAIGNATRGVTFDGCYFNTGEHHIAGRWWQGAKFTACQFNQAKDFFGDISPAAGAGQPPVFVFEHCSFEGSGSSPADSKNKDVRWVIINCRKSDGTMIRHLSNFDETFSQKDVPLTESRSGQSITWGSGALNGTMAPSVRAFEFINIKTGIWQTIPLNVANNGAWMFIISGQHGEPKKIICSTKADASASPAQHTVMSSCPGTVNKREIEFRWKASTLNPEFRVTSGTGPETQVNVTITAIGSGGTM